MALDVSHGLPPNLQTISHPQTTENLREHNLQHMTSLSALLRNGGMEGRRRGEGEEGEERNTKQLREAIRKKMALGKKKVRDLHLAVVLAVTLYSLTTYFATDIATLLAMDAVKEMTEQVNAFISINFTLEQRKLLHRNGFLCYDCFLTVTSV